MSYSLKCICQEWNVNPGLFKWTRDSHPTTEPNNSKQFSYCLDSGKSVFNHGLNPPDVASFQTGLDGCELF